MRACVRIKETEILRENVGEDLRLTLPDIRQTGGRVFIEKEVRVMPSFSSAILYVWYIRVGVGVAFRCARH